jgi:tetratricopeptide (TPR) repeat protein
VHLLAPPDPAAREALDAHPLVREWFGDRLRQTNEAAWKAAHGRLYEHLRDTTKEGNTPTLEDLAPLYQAIAHGCRAGRHQEALDKIYRDRICRRQPDGKLEFYASQKLGAFSSDLAAISWFFDKPYATPAAALTPTARSWMLSIAAFRLRVQGRFAEALPGDRAALRMREDAQDWISAATVASNLSQAELLTGEVAAAVATAEKSVAHADRSGDEFQMLGSRAAYADALRAAGRREEAARAFADAEQRQREWQPADPLLYSMQGYLYCDLLLAEGDHAPARDRASQTAKIARRENWLPDIALDTLTLGRAHLGLALVAVAMQRPAKSARRDSRIAVAHLDEAVDRLRVVGALEFINRGLLGHSASCRNVGDWEGAARDLDEVEEIAEHGPMRLYLCDTALERARLGFAQIEAFAPLNGMLEKDNPPKPAVPSADEIAELKSEAEKQLKIAADYIETCGYHRRDEELAELQAVLRGEKKFANLPPRV